MPKKKVLTTPTPQQQMMLVDKRAVLSAIIDVVSRMPGFGLHPIQIVANQPPDDPQPGWNVSTNGSARSEKASKAMKAYWKKRRAAKKTSKP